MYSPTFYILYLLQHLLSSLLSCFFAPDFFLNSCLLRHFNFTGYFPFLTVLSQSFTLQPFMISLHVLPKALTLFNVFFCILECLALPKLNLQFLTLHDYLLRNHNLFQLESTCKHSLQLLTFVTAFQIYCNIFMYRYLCAVTQVAHTFHHLVFENVSKLQ